MTDEPRNRFSRRYGFSEPRSDDLIHHDAPVQLRCGVLQVAHDSLKMAPSTLRRIICGVLRVRSDASNWSEYPNIWNEVQDDMHRCEWFHVYDIIEAIRASLDRRSAQQFDAEINELFEEERIGWQLLGGELQVRGDEAFENVLAGAAEVLEDSGLPTATSELQEALRDLSRRPDPDLSGAVHHAMAALECVARELVGDPKRTLGEIIKKYPGLIPKPLDGAVGRLWGYASEQARHGRESRDLAWAEAQLIVGMSSVLCSYLVQKKSE